MMLIDQRFEMREITDGSYFVDGQISADPWLPIWVTCASFASISMMVLVFCACCKRGVSKNQGNAGGITNLSKADSAGQNGSAEAVENEGPAQHHRPDRGSRECCTTCTCDRHRRKHRRNRHRRRRHERCHRTPGHQKEEKMPPATPASAPENHKSPYVKQKAERKRLELKIPETKQEFASHRDPAYRTLYGADEQFLPSDKSKNQNSAQYVDVQQT